MTVGKQRRVTLKPRWWEGGTPVETVLIDEAGNVTLENGTTVGRVEKGYRTSSPPIGKGSPIARHHRRVAEWQGWRPGSTGFRPEVRADTRIDVIRRLTSLSEGR